MNSNLKKIKVIGIGSGGIPVIQQLQARSDQPENIDYAAISADLMLQSADAPKTHCVHVPITEEEKQALKLEMQSTDVVILIAGLCGKNSNAIVLELAQLAKSLSIFTVIVATTPFADEGQKKQMRAQNGIKTLRSCSDTLIEISNEHLFGDCNQSKELRFAKSDRYVCSIVESLLRMINNPGLIACDLDDLRQLAKKDLSVVSTAEAPDKAHVLNAIEKDEFSNQEVKNVNND